MSEPIILYRNGETIQTESPSTARALEAIGWQRMPDGPVDVPVDELPVNEIVSIAFIEAAEASPAKRGRPKKST